MKQALFFPNSIQIQRAMQSIRDKCDHPFFGKVFITLVTRFILTQKNFPKGVKKNFHFRRYIDCCMTQNEQINLIFRLAYHQIFLLSDE